VNYSMVLQAVVVLTGAGHLLLAQDDAVAAKARKTTDKLNAHLMHKARGSADVAYLGSPLTGGGISVGRFSQLFLLARNSAKNGGQPADWAQFTWNILSAQGQRLLKEGKTLESAEDNLAELQAQATVFAQKQLPILKALQIA
jgi:hypothetical protein